MAPPPVRGSVRARAFRQACALLARPIAAGIPVNAFTLPAARVLIERALTAAAPTLRGTTAEPVRGRAVHGEWVRGPKADRTDAAILYVHGGGFVAGSARAFRGVASRLSTATRLPVFALDYRLAPEHPFPAPQHDVAAGYRWLLSIGFEPDRIVVAGDSAGAYLAADFVIAQARTGLPGPAALVLFSPMTDLRLTLAARFEGGQRDGLLSAELSRRAVSHATPLPLDLRPTQGLPLPPLLVHAGGAEFFGGDGIELAARWSEVGAVSELQLWPDQMHVFQALPVFVPESRAAYRAAARFIRTHVPVPERLAQ